jgi:hypothetical protein
MEKYIMSFLPYKNMKMKLQADARKARQLLAAAKRPAKRQKKKKEISETACPPSGFYRWSELCIGLLGGWS